jgi:hypothetical protein
MHYTPRIFFSDDIFDTVPEPEDDIDELFRNLEQVEPPPAVIQRILSSVSQLPPPVSPETISPTPPVEPVPPVPSETPRPLDVAPQDSIDPDQSNLLWNLLDGLVVRKEQCEPS